MLEYAALALLIIIVIFIIYLFIYFHDVPYAMRAGPVAGAEAAVTTSDSVSEESICI